MNHLFWKRRLGQLMTWRAPAHQRHVILIYHSIAAMAPAVTMARFSKQLSWLVHHAHLLTLEELLRKKSDGGGGEELCVAITFDDGYASLHDVVAPLLEGKVGATVYLNTGHIGSDQRQASLPALGHYPNDHFLLWHEVKALAKAGWIIGSHGVEHKDLTCVSASEAELQLRHSREHIQRELAQPCQHFAYTWGHFNHRLQELVRHCGYQTAASGLHGPLMRNSDLYALPRIDVRADYELEDFVAAISGQWDFLGYKQRMQRWL